MDSYLVSELCHAAKVLNRIGCLPATDGNFSVRASGEKVIVTRKGIEKRQLTRDDLVMADLKDAQPGDASSEWKLHRALYKARSDINAILHVHAPLLGAFVAAAAVPDVSLLMETEQTLGGFALIPYADPGTAKIGELAVEHGGQAGVLILERHGVVAVGSSIREALHRIERAEFLARVQLAQKLI